LGMKNERGRNQTVVHVTTVVERFLEDPNEDTFADVFYVLTPQLVAFFRARNCKLGLAEDLAQEVMLKVFRKASQIRDRHLFRNWLFKIARNTLRRYYADQSREVATVELSDGVERAACASPNPAGSPAFEFHRWMIFLDSKERDVMTLRFIEEWEYHEIAAAREIPIGTVQWRVFNAKKKLAPFLTTRFTLSCKAA
jgi:RNA polymerase sigma-70 factor (ECF subfamily)